MTKCQVNKLLAFSIPVCGRKKHFFFHCNICDRLSVHLSLYTGIVKMGNDFSCPYKQPVNRQHNVMSSREFDFSFILNSSKMTSFHLWPPHSPLAPKQQNCSVRVKAKDMKKHCISCSTSYRSYLPTYYLISSTMQKWDRIRTAYNILCLHNMLNKIIIFC